VREQIEPCGDGFRLAHKGGSDVSNLSDRERSMLEYLAKGASLKYAARLIGVSYKTADHLKQRVMKKLDVHDRAELVRRAIREGWRAAATVRRRPSADLRRPRSRGPAARPASCPYPLCFVDFQPLNSLELSIHLVGLPSSRAGRQLSREPSGSRVNWVVGQEDLPL